MRQVAVRLRNKGIHIFSLEFSDANDLANVEEIFMLILFLLSANDML